MGLDMYLQRKRYVRFDEREQLKVAGLSEPVETDKVMYIVSEAGYWRKANAIHRWFVEHVQGGNDDCKEHWVTRAQLAELLDTVNTVLAGCELVEGQVFNGIVYENSKATQVWQAGKVVKDPTVAQSLLPTTAGFFFGSTEYDQYYVEDLVETQRILREALNAEESGDFYYQSSW